jgi:hypothetical protein
MLRRLALFAVLAWNFLADHKRGMQGARLGAGEVLRGDRVASRSEMQDVFHSTTGLLKFMNQRSLI